MAPGAILFDLDGTLLDTLEDIAAAANHALATLGQPTHPAAAYGRMVGSGADRLIQRALPPGRGDLLDEGLRRFKAYYARHMLDHTRPFPGISGLLDRIVQRGLPLAVVSNKPHEATRRVVEALLSRWPWGAVRGEQAGRPRKPEPDPALDVARGLEVDPGDCWFVGDSAIDMETARRAGMFGIGVAWGLNTVDELEAGSARLIVDEPADLLRLLDRHASGVAGT